MLVRLVTKHDQAKIRLAKQIKGRTEVLCRAGRIDILTNSEAIEVKSKKQWKHGVGQALVYAKATNRFPRLHLYGNKRLGQFEEKMIAGFGIRLSYDLDELEGV